MLAGTLVSDQQTLLLETPLPTPFTAEARVATADLVAEDTLAVVGSTAG